MPLNQTFSMESMVARPSPGWFDPLLVGGPTGYMRATAFDIMGMSWKVYKVPDT